MTKRESLADARQFVTRTFEEVDGRAPSKKAIEASAKKIASALRSITYVPAKRER